MDAAGWDKKSTTYADASDPLTAKFTAEAVEHASLPAGARCLDVACGSGAMTFAAARRGHHVVATDFSSGMVQALERKLAAEPEDVRARVETAVADGQTLAG
jgi:ubiquinone/menaquinone biosynthesis C-methylase UbiE